MVFPVPPISSLSSFALERYVASIFQAHGYFVKRDLLWDENLVLDTSRSVNILQADGLAYLFAPLGESKILIECKGGGTFTDFFKFSGIANLVRPDSSFFVCNNSPNFDEIHKLGEKLNITVLQPNNIISRFSIPGIVDEINYWFWANEIQDFLFQKERLIEAITGITAFSSDQTAAYSEIKKYNASLSKVWTEFKPNDQANSIAKYFEDNRDFVRKIWRLQGLRKAPEAEIATSQNILCESAANIVLKHKVEYLITAVRCAIATLTSTDPTFLETISDDTFRAVVQKMIDSIQVACRLPQFLQVWIYQFGGILNLNNNEVSVIAKLINERDETIKLFIDLLEDIFRVVGSINWGISKTAGILEFKGVPESIRGYGIWVRQKKGIDISTFVFKEQWIRRLKLITGYS
ncbi:hypothetical protein [Ferruginibacter sp.]